MKFHFCVFTEYRFKKKLGMNDKELNFLITGLIGGALVAMQGNLSKKNPVKRFSVLLETKERLDKLEQDVKDLSALIINREPTPLSHPKDESVLDRKCIEITNLTTANKEKDNEISSLKKDLQSKTDRIKEVIEQMLANDNHSLTRFSALGLEKDNEISILKIQLHESSKELTNTVAEKDRIIDNYATTQEDLLKSLGKVKTEVRNSNLLYENLFANNENALEDVSTLNKMVEDKDKLLEERDLVIKGYRSQNDGLSSANEECAREMQIRRGEYKQLHDDHERLKHEHHCALDDIRIYKEIGEELKKKVYHYEDKCNAAKTILLANNFQEK